MQAIRTLLTTIGVLGLVASGSLVASGTALASTPGCTGMSMSGNCGDNVNVYGNAFDVLRGRAAVNTPIISWRNSRTDPATDFIRTTVQAGEYRYQYAPHGRPSGLCISNPAGSYQKDPMGPDGLVLRPCNGSQYQVFQMNISNINGNELLSLADLTVITPNGTGAQITGTSQESAMTHPGSYWKWES